MNLKQLRAIQAIMQHGTIAAAANALGLTPPAVTIQLKLLEEDANIILLTARMRACGPPPPGWPFSMLRKWSMNGCACSKTRSMR